MKKVYLVFICLLVCTALFSQGINKMDDEGKRHGYWQGTYEQSKRPRYEGTFEHGKEVGVFKFFEDDKTSTLYATRSFAKDGSCQTTFVDEKGNKVSEGKEADKLKEGKWTYYHPGGKTVMSTENYVKGKLSGKRVVYFPNGAVAEEISFVNDLKEGPYKQYTEKGILLEESVYKNNQLHGPAVYRNSQGELVSKGKFANDLKTGIWEYYEKGKVVKKEDMTNKKVQLARKKRTE